jgi:hypothetical protein
VTAQDEEVLRSMSMNKIKLAALTFLVVGAVSTGAGYTGQAQARQAGKPDLRQEYAGPAQARQAGKPDLRQIAAKPDAVVQRQPPAECS